MDRSLTRDALSVRLIRLATIGLLVAVLTAAFASAQVGSPDQCDECNLWNCCLNCCHEPPEFWVINTRCAPRCRDLDEGFERISYKRYDRRRRRFVKESRESFLAQEAAQKTSMPTLFYAHGNGLKHKPAMGSFWRIYRKLRCCPGKKRLVCWSWPSDRVYKTEGLRIREMIKKNLRVKYVYAEYQGYYLAKLVDQMSLSQRVTISGHSYGAISVAAALHYMGGGCLRGLTLAGGAPVERANLRAVLIAGSLDNHMMNPGHRYGQAFVTAEKIFVTRNCHDRMLNFFPKFSGRGCPAIGAVGINARRLGEYRSKLCQQTTYPDVGRSHYMKRYLTSARFVSALCCLSFPSCESCKATSSRPSVISDQPEETIGKGLAWADETLGRDDGVTSSRRKKRARL